MNHLTPTEKGINRDWIIGGFLLFLLFYPESKTRKRASASSNNLSGLATASKTLKGNRLYYLWQEPGHEPKTKPRSDLAKLKKRAQRGSGRLYAVYARSADHARSEIKRGKAEIYSIFGGLGCEMFGKCPRPQGSFRFGQDPLVLERERAPQATDPMEDYLHDMGWKVIHIWELQASIAEKERQEKITGKRKRLTPMEKELQADIEIYLTHTAAREKKAKAKPKPKAKPLDEHLWEMGWKVVDIWELQASIADKQTQEKLTGKKRPLTKLEKKLQADIESIMSRLEPKPKPKRKLIALDDGLLGLGWKIEDIRKTKASIAKKQKETRETGKKYKLTVGEIALIQDIEHIKRVIKARKQGKAIPTRDKPLSTQKTKAKVKLKPRAKPQIARDISGSLLYCSEWQLVDSEFYGHPVPRCLKMKQACNGKDCLYAKAPRKERIEEKPKAKKKSRA